MKKSLSSLIFFTLLLTSHASFAEQQSDVFLCPFQETLVLKDVPAGTQILALSANQLAVQQQGTSQFIIFNIKQPCTNGTVTATIGLNDKNFTTITFHDGPWIFMEIKSVENHGTFKFSKWNPDFKKHYYELNFVNTGGNNV